MRVLVSFALLLALSAVPSAAGAWAGEAGQPTLERLHRDGTDFFEDPWAPFIVPLPPAPTMGSAPTLPPHRWGGPPSVEHTDVGVTIVRGPSMR